MDLNCFKERAPAALQTANQRAVRPAPQQLDDEYLLLNLLERNPGLRDRQHGAVDYGEKKGALTFAPR